MQNSASLNSSFLQYNSDDGLSPSLLRLIVCSMQLFSEMAWIELLREFNIEFY